MIKKITCLGLVSIFAVPILYANDSTGYVATGGVAYVKNPNISMQKKIYLSVKNKSVLNMSLKI